MPSFIMQSYTRAEHSVGRIYADYVAKSIDTHISISGGWTVTLPAAPSEGQTIIVTGDGFVTDGVSTWATGTGGLIAIWGGYSWCIINGADCSVIQMPPTYDFGVLEYAGPSETAYAVPQTTTTPATVGATPCGASLRKTVTKTYSGRSTAGQWRYDIQNTSAFFYSSVYVGQLADNIGVISAWVMANAPASINCAIYGAQYLYLPTTDSKYLSSVNPIYCADIGAGTGCDNHYFSPTQLTLYYLDVHEVWTYEII